MRTREANPRLTPEALHEWRKSIGMTQAEVAAALHVSRVAWTLWERGKRQPPYYLGYALNWLRQQRVPTL